MLHRPLRAAGCGNHVPRASQRGARGVRAGRPRAGACTAEAGFTLIEVVVAITLLSLICLALFSAIHLSTRAWERSAAPLETALETQAIAGLMRRQLAQTHAIFAQDGGDTVAAFYGDERTMRFISPLPSHRGVGGLYVMEFSLNARDELLLSYEIYRPQKHLPLEEVAFANVEVLAEGLGEVGFEYAAGLRSGETEWMPQFASGGRFPAAVRLSDFSEGVPRSIWTFAIPARDSRFRVAVSGIAARGQGQNESDGDQQDSSGNDDPQNNPPANQAPSRPGKSLDMWQGTKPYYEDFEYVPPTEQGPAGTAGCGTEYIC